MNVIAEGVEIAGPPELPAPPPLRLRPGQAVRRARDARRAAPAAGPPAGNRPGLRRPDRPVREPRQDRQAARRLTACAAGDFDLPLANYLSHLAATISGGHFWPAGAALSSRSTMSTMRRALAARSDDDQRVGSAGYAARCAACGMSGRSTGTAMRRADVLRLEQHRDEFVVERLRRNVGGDRDRQLPRVRVGHDLHDAVRLRTRRTGGRRGWRAACRSPPCRDRCPAIRNLARTRGSTMNCLPVRFATLSMRSVISMPESAFGDATHGEQSLAPRPMPARAAPAPAPAPTNDTFSFLSSPLL